MVVRHSVVSHQNVIDDPFILLWEFNPVVVLVENCHALVVVLQTGVEDRTELITEVLVSRNVVVIAPIEDICQGVGVVIDSGEEDGSLQHVLLWLGHTELFEEPLDEILLSVVNGNLEQLNLNFLINMFFGDCNFLKFVILHPL